MLRFRDQPWLLNRRSTRIDLLVQSPHAHPDELFWEVNFEYHPGGTEWLGVELLHRPRLEVSVAGFDPGVGDWRELDRVSYWHRRPNDGLCLLPQRGVAEVRLWAPDDLPHRQHQTDTTDHTFRFIRRDGPFFLVELAVLADGTSIYRSDEAGAAQLVAPDGTPLALEPDEAFWRRVNPQLYLIEEVPFGLISVCVPHNVKAPAAFAEALAHRLLKCGRPDHVEVWNFWNRDRPEANTGSADSLWVKLHYGGDWRD